MKDDSPEIRITLRQRVQWFAWQWRGRYARLMCRIAGHRWAGGSYWSNDPYLHVEYWGNCERCLESYGPASRIIDIPDGANQAVKSETKGTP